MSYDPEKTKDIPTIESSVFDVQDATRFAIGVVAINDHVVDGHSKEWNGAAELRKNTYLRKGFVRLDELNGLGNELDEDDARSAHFSVLERTATEGLARVVGNMRLILKLGDAPLPIERFYPEAFAEPLPQMSMEVSRLISRHEDSHTQRLIKWPLFIGAVKYVEKHQLDGAAYGLLEPSLTETLLAQQVPLTPIAEAKYIPEISATKQPVEINVPTLSRVIKLTGDYGIDVGDDFSYLNFKKREVK